jgi:5-methyltetrahydrofolate--homocysteine methyltransferase
MPIDFNNERWEQVKKNYRDWWDGKLGRPLIHMMLGRSPARPEPKPGVARTEKEISYDLSIMPEEIVDRWDYKLSGREFLGDSFPSVWPDFGPGVLAAFLGAKAEPTEGTVWFHPAKELEPEKIHFALDPENIWLKRVKDICRAALARWDGLVQVGMTDLGGNLDVLSTFRPGEKLLLDLVDSPQEVKRLTWEAHAAWWQAFDEINAVLKPLNPGYTAWTPIFSESPYYMLQCDFAYMIGPQMFAEFVRPELEASCRRLKHAFYHLDGIGQLPHLDSLLSIRELKGVQWIPGEGQPQGERWPEVYRKIIAAGKRAQFVGDWRNFDSLIRQTGGAENFIVFGSAPQRERNEVKAFLKRYGAL